ncbi:type II toxin-antitoxin system RelE/ParE family toxin [Desulfonema limicola]|nr:type II toxin-antitoxin system RelE/ParE family toxin [Desulfonema limicola]
MRKINFYRDKAGYSPVEEFLDSLNVKQARKVVWVLRLIEEQEIIPSTYFKKLINTEDIWEARIQFGSDIFRILGFFEENNVIILTHAFQKKSQKTPKKEIHLAEIRKKDHLMRK